MPDEDRRFAVYALYGPPVPVPVVEVRTELDPSNHHALIAVLTTVAAAARTPSRCRATFGCHRVAETVVLDLRGAGFVSTRTLRALAEHPLPVRSLRLLIGHSDTAIPRILRFLGLTDTVETYRRITDAALADATVCD